MIIQCLNSIGDFLYHWRGLCLRGYQTAREADLEAFGPVLLQPFLCQIPVLGHAATLRSCVSEDAMTHC